RLHDIAVEDTAVAILEFASGALGTIEAATSAYPGYSRRLELTGSNGTLRIDGDDLVGIDVRGTPADASVRQPAIPTESAASPVVTDASAHRRVFEDFFAAVTRRSSPCCDGPDGRRSLEVVEAIY